MKIGLVASNFKPIPSPPNSIFAPGLVVNNLANGLIKKGHEVTVFAADDSKTGYKVISFGLNSVYKDILNFKDKKPEYYCDQRSKYELFLISKAIEQANNFDILHFHDYRKAIYFSHLVNTPFLFTFHDSFNLDLSKIDKKTFDRFKNSVYFSALSKNHMEKIKNKINFVGIVNNGISLSDFNFSQKGGDNLLFIGRFIENKGLDLAIDIAEKAKQKIIIVGAPGVESGEINYWQTK